MELPQVIAVLVKAQNDQDSLAYSECFAQTAVVFDEGSTHTGKQQIRNWIANANKKYQTILKPVAFKETDGQSILSAQVSGSFEGSPAFLNYHFELDSDGLITSLKVT